MESQCQPVSGGADPLGVWEDPAEPSGALDADAGPGDAEDTVWRVRLPAGGDEGNAVLHTREALLASRRERMREARRSLDDVGVQAGGISYALPHLPPREGRTAEGQRVLDSVCRLLSTSIRVETESGGRVVGATRISFLGDLQTVSSPAATEDDAALHRRAVSLAAETRLARMEFAGHVLSGAAVLAAKLVLPGGPLLALPDVWSYMRRALELGEEVGA